MHNEHGYAKFFAQGGRGSGRSYRQIRSCPKNSIFICPTNDTSYYKRMAVELGRGDIEFRSAAWLDEYRLKGRACHVEVDHAVALTQRQYEALKEAEFRRRRYDEV